MLLKLQNKLDDSCSLPLKTAPGAEETMHAYERRRQKIIIIEREENKRAIIMISF